MATPAARTAGIGIAIVVLVAAGIAGFYWWQRSEPPYLPPPQKVQAPPPAAPAGPRYPVAADTAKPLPALNESDASLREALLGIVGPQPLERFFNLEDIVRHIVVTVDNLPRETLAARLSPMKPVGGAFVVKGDGGKFTLAPENGARYTPLVRVMEQADAKKVVALYSRFYPLFQQAYVELGYPGRYFNDRLVEAIDNMLAAPDLQGPVALVAPHVLYEFEDPDLQNRSAGQKIMMRIGRDNEAKVKAKLRELRAEVVAMDKRPQ